MVNDPKTDRYTTKNFLTDSRALAVREAEKIGKFDKVYREAARMFLEGWNGRNGEVALFTFDENAVVSWASIYVISD
jgi:hypothetical protein